MIGWLQVCFANPCYAQNSLREQFEPLIEASCIGCHDDATDTRLNFDELGHDLTDRATFRMWESIFDRVDSGEMPPASEDRPDDSLVKDSLHSLESHLLSTSKTLQESQGRVPNRRLTRLEHDYTLRDLLGLDRSYLSLLPEENNSGGFDTVGERQGISPLHIRSYLKVADKALGEAIQLGPKPYRRTQDVDFLNSPYLKMMNARPLEQGGSVLKFLDDAVVQFVDLDYLLKSNLNGVNVTEAGLYRIKAEVYAYQPPKSSPLVMKLIFTSASGGESRLLESYELPLEGSREIEVETWLEVGDTVYPTFENMSDKIGIYTTLAIVGAERYRGPGLAVKALSLEGPLVESWPPTRTTNLLVDAKPVTSKRKDRWGRPLYHPALTKEPIEHIKDSVKRILPLAYRRPVGDAEVASKVELANQALASGRNFIDGLQISLRSILTSPDFLFFDRTPGRLDDFALASRLSYFLWKSMPDAELLELAEQGKLSDPAVLNEQVNRMLADEKSNRFVDDFLGQWLHLYDLNATTPDQKLYPEFDELLSNSLPMESKMFFRELIDNNLGVSNFVDSDFVFVNSRLAKLYRIPNVSGQKLQRVALPEKSLRGGFLTQAAILKTTANGTTTSPVVRGNFVLTNILGLPPNPPPPNVGSIEPDTRGTTTIRETLDAHRNTEDCAMCHRKIDPPGFALESFDPIGNYRKNYRTSSSGKLSFFKNKSYGYGPKVDSSGQMPDGKPFNGIREYKQLLLQQRSQVARHFLSQLIVYSTGAEIQFADRAEVESILKSLKEEDYPVKSLIHAVTQSHIFQNL
jgi:hypothetical protein